mmetsp:Transcript_57757/g.134534  ORF Transcript_57757/g.134534 Transcript_57757/m.134534 type:complete len:142 (+) Transcript_57757:221-646(+)
MPVRTGPSRAGLAAQRDFCARLAQLHLALTTQPVGRVEPETVGQDSAPQRRGSGNMGASDKGPDYKADLTAEWLYDAFEQGEPLDWTGRSARASHVQSTADWVSRSLAADLGGAGVAGGPGQQSFSRRTELPEHKCVSASF